MLYVTFRFILGFERAAALPIALFWCVIAACGGALIVISLLCFRFIEAPRAGLVDRVTRRLRPAQIAESNGST